MLLKNSTSHWMRCSSIPHCLVFILVKNLICWVAFQEWVIPYQIVPFWKGTYTASMAKCTHRQFSRKLSVLIVSSSHWGSSALIWLSSRGKRDKLLVSVVQAPLVLRQSGDSDHGVWFPPRIVGLDFPPGASYIWPEAGPTASCELSDGLTFGLIENVSFSGGRPHIFSGGWSCRYKLDLILFFKNTI